MLYLKGDIYIQIYPPLYSTETRLIIDKKRDNFIMHEYDYRAYEEKMLNYNLTIRANIPMYFKDSASIKNHIYGFNDSYDSVVEYYIIYSYLKEYTQQVPPQENILNLLFDIRKYHFDSMPDFGGGISQGRTVQTCQLRTLVKSKFASYNEFLKWINTRYYDNSIINIEKDLINILNIFKGKVRKNENYSQNLMHKFTVYSALPTLSTSHVHLPKSRYSYQIGVIKKDILLNKHYTNTILKYFKTLAKDKKYTKLYRLI